MHRLETAPSLGSVTAASAAPALPPRPSSAAATGSDASEASRLGDSIMSMLQLGDAGPPASGPLAGNGISRQPSPSAASTSSSSAAHLPAPRSGLAPGAAPFAPQQQQPLPGARSLQHLAGGGGGSGSFGSGSYSAFGGGPASAGLSLSRPHSVAGSSRGVTPPPPSASPFAPPQPAFSPARGYGPASGPMQPQQQLAGAFLPRPNGSAVGNGSWGAGGLPGMNGPQWMSGEGLGGLGGGLGGLGGQLPGGDAGRQFLEALSAALWALPAVRSALANAGAGPSSSKPAGHAAAALRSLFGALTAQQQQSAGGVSLAAVPEHIRNALWRDFSSAGDAVFTLLCL